ncbi:MAG: tripartite tricarboxylate transporter substrate binding protein [Betaproteobacteria bacterium]|nr:tripartite tricarboxylate transporter substrate binding protein [Betaproteobacteria bacterium]
MAVKCVEPARAGEPCASLRGLPLYTLLAAAVPLALAGALHAQTYPVKPIRVLIGYPAGAGNDVIGRLVFAEISRTLGQQIVVDNRPGASGQIATDMAARSAPDGYTLLNVPGSIAMANSLYPKLPYDLLKDFDPIALQASVPFLLVVPPTLPVKNLRELIALAKARPGDFTFGSAGAGGGPHLTAELFAMRAGIKMLHVPYRGTVQANAAVASGELTMIFSPSSSVMPMIQSQRVRALAITSRERHPTLPQVPTVAEAAYADFHAGNWIALIGPSGMPGAAVARLNSEINRVVQTAAMRERFAALGATPLSATPQEATAFVHEEVAKWAKVVKSAGIRLP